MTAPALADMLHDGVAPLVLLINSSSSEGDSPAYGNATAETAASRAKDERAMVAVKHSGCLQTGGSARGAEPWSG